jgi:hypothetical protein
MQQLAFWEKKPKQPNTFWRRQPPKSVLDQ